jgi:hypothetical protein
MLNGPPSALTAISGHPVRQDVLDGLKSASEKTGVSFDFLVAEATRESGLNPNAKAPTTSARGLFQFTSQTWLEVFKVNGAKYGKGEMAKKIKRGEDGTLDVADEASKKTILGLRQDPEISALMAAEYAKSNEKRLETRLGRDVGPSDLYLAHFLGPNGAARFIDVSEKSPDKVAAKLMPQAARHNHSVFYDGNKPRSVAAVYDQVRQTIDGTIQQLAQARAEGKEILAAAPAAKPALQQVAAASPPKAEIKVDAKKQAAQAEADNRRETARQALLAQLSTPVAPLVDAAQTSRGAESDEGLRGNRTPKVSLPMPPPLVRRPDAQPVSPGSLEGLMRRVRMSVLG